MYVYFYLFTRAGLARLDAATLEAAQALGAGRWRTLRRVTLPLIRPSLAGAALLTFMTSLGSFSAPYVFGGGFRVMTTQIFASKQNGELGVAMVETVALALVALAGLALLRRTEGDAILAGLGKGTAPRRRTLRRPLVRLATTLAGWGFAVLLLLPHATLILVSLVPYATWTTETLPPVLGLVNYGRLFAEPERLEPLVNSLWMAAASTAAAVALALAAGWLVVRRRAALRRVIEGLLALPWALPGTVFAVALATAFSVSAPLQLRWVLVGTVADSAARLFRAEPPGDGTGHPRRVPPARSGARRGGGEPRCGAVAHAAPRDAAAAQAGARRGRESCLRRARWGISSRRSCSIPTATGPSRWRSTPRCG